MSDSLLSARDGPDASASRDSDGESAEIDQVMLELKELARRDAPGKKLPYLGSKIGEIFGGEYGKRHSSERWHDHRMKVMRALGICLMRCKKVRNLGLGRAKGLSFLEVEVLLRGLEHSTVLKKVEFSWLSDLQYFAGKDASACWSLVAYILRSAANLEAFRMDGMRGNRNLVQITSSHV